MMFKHRSWLTYDAFRKRAKNSFLNTIFSKVSEHDPLKRKKNLNFPLNNTVQILCSFTSTVFHKIERILWRAYKNGSNAFLLFNSVFKSLESHWKFLSLAWWQIQAKSINFILEKFSEKMFKPFYFCTTKK